MLDCRSPHVRCAISSGAGSPRCPSRPEASTSTPCSQAPSHGRVPHPPLHASSHLRSLCTCVLLPQPSVQDQRLTRFPSRLPPALSTSRGTVSARRSWGEGSSARDRTRGPRSGARFGIRRRRRGFWGRTRGRLTGGVGPGPHGKVSFLPSSLLPGIPSLSARPRSGVVGPGGRRGRGGPGHPTPAPGVLFGETRSESWSASALEPGSGKRNSRLLLPPDPGAPDNAHL